MIQIFDPRSFPLRIVLFALAAVVGSARPALADEGTLKVEAVAQYVEGQTEKLEPSGAKTNLVYQTPIYEGDRIETASKSVLKLAARNGCLFVLRGDGVVAAPIGRKPWRVRAESVRILCSGRSQAETFGVASRPLSIRDGEILFMGSGANLRAMLLSGAASLHGQALELRKLYAFQASSLAPVSPQPSEAELRKLNLEQKPPREAATWPAPPKSYTSRFVFGIASGFDHAGYDASELSQGGLHGDGPRFQFQFRTHDDRALIVSATFRESEDKSKYGGPNSPPADGPQNTLEESLLEVGMRNRFDRWWSPFWKVGAGFVKSKIGYSQPNPGFGSNYTRFAYEFYVLSAAYGIDARLAPHFLRPFGLYASAEAQVVQSVTRGARENLDTGYSNGSEPSEPWRLTILNAALSLGIETSF